MNYSYETPTFRGNRIEAEYRRSPKHSWKTLDMLDVPELKKTEYRVWNLPLSVAALLACILAITLPTPIWFYALVGGFILMGVASAIGPKRTRLALRTCRQELNLSGPEGPRF